MGVKDVKSIDELFNFRCYIRLMNINTEIGIVFKNPEIAAHSSDNFDKHIDKVAFRVELVDDKLRWTGLGEGGKQVVFDVEPYTSFWQRLGIGFLSILPIESQL